MSMVDRFSELLAGVLAAALLAGTAGAQAPDRAQAIREEIARLRSDLEALESEERGLLGEVARLSATLSLRDAELREATMQREAVERAIADRSGRIERLRDAQSERAAFLRVRLREIYKRGPLGTLRVLAGGEDTERYLTALRYALYESERDARTIGAFERDSLALVAQNEALAAERSRLDELHSAATEARQSVRRTRARRQEMLRGIQQDRRQRQSALGELEEAARGLGEFVDSLEDGGERSSLDIRKFRGLLSWPSVGTVSAGFGNVVHPRFKTVVPHPGIDIEADEGSDIRAIFDGTVAYAGWLRGYGLTTIVNHGNAVVSVYAHASVLIVETGEEVYRDQTLGKVGDTGSLRGPFLYFEIREGGKPVDPARWLHDR